MDHKVSSALSFLGGVYIGVRALLDINLIWFGNIARLSQRGVGGYFTRSNDFYLPSLRLEGGGGVSTPLPVIFSPKLPIFLSLISTVPVSVSKRVIFTFY
jgi:hypothetical protein